VVGLGRGMHRYPPTCDSTELNDPTATLPSVGLRSRLFNHVGKTLKQHCGVQQTGDAEPALSRAQRSMFDIINQYKVGVGALQQRQRVVTVLLSAS